MLLCVVMDNRGGAYMSSRGRTASGRGGDITIVSA